MSCATGGGEFAARVALPPVVEGDTWGGREFELEVLLDEGPPAVWGAPASELADVVMQFHSGEDRLDELLTLSVTGTEIDIVDAAGWRFVVLPTVLPLGPGVYFWGLRTVADDGTIWTPVKGSISVDRKGVVVP
jgi:hypothetical protein